MFVKPESIPFHFSSTKELELNFSEIEFPVVFERMAKTVKYLLDNEFQPIKPVKISDLSNI